MLHKCYVRSIVHKCCACPQLSDYYVRFIVYKSHHVLRALYRSLANALDALNADTQVLSALNGS